MTAPLDLEGIKARLACAENCGHEAPTVSSWAYSAAEARVDLAALVAEVERLSAKLDAACEMGRDHITRSKERRNGLIAANTTIERLAKERAEARAEVERLREVAMAAHDYLAARNLGDPAWALRGRLREALGL